MNKKFKLWSLMLAAVMAVSGMSLLVTACAPDEGDPNTPDDPNPPVTHTHTFDETKWMSDADQHWHAATCEHTTEKSDVAVHTFVANECTVCHYVRTVEKTAKCDDYCEICGKCIEVRCTEDTDKCGMGLTAYNFEVEEAQLTQSPAHPDWGLTINENLEDKENPYYNGYCVFLQGLTGGGGINMTFVINSDKDTTATFRVRCGTQSNESHFTDTMLVLINDELWESPSWVRAHQSGGVNAKRDFNWVNLGCITLKKGENVISITVSSVSADVGYNMDKIQLLSDATLSWTPTDNTASYYEGMQQPTDDDLIALDDWWMEGDLISKKLSELK